MKKYGLLLLPLIAGMALAALWQARLWINPILYLRADVGTLLLLLGLAGSAMWAAGLLLRSITRHDHQLSLQRFQHEQAEAHLRFIRRLDHELKNPLTAIHAGLANLNEQGDGVALTSVRTQVDRLARQPTSSARAVASAARGRRSRFALFGAAQPGGQCVSSAARTTRLRSALLKMARR